MTRILKLCASSLALIVGTSAWAQSDEPFDLGTIVITGQKTDRSLQDTDASVAVITPGDGAAAATDDVLQAAERIPNVGLFAGERGIAIRGVGQTGFGFGETNFGLTRSPSDLIATYIDGIPVSTYAGPTAFWDVGQVEILRGPQSTLLGRGSLGGAVVIETNRPIFERENAARLTFGTNGTRGLSLMTGGAIIPETLAFRLTLDGQTTDGFNDNLSLGQPEDAQEALSGRLKFLYLGDNGTELELTAFKSRREVGSVFVDGGLYPQQRATFSDVADENINDSYGISLRGSFELGEALTLESTTAWVKEDARRIFDIDQTAAPIASGVFEDEIETLLQEFRLRYEKGQFSGFAGLYAERFEGTGSFDAGALGNRTVRQKTDTLALFGEGEWQFANGIDLTFGLRMEREESSVTTSDGSATVVSDADFSSVLPKLGLSYAVSDQTRIYATVQRGYRAGGAGGSLITGTPYSFDPEYTTNFDLGARFESADGRTRLGANLFHVKWSDQQLEIPSGSGRTGDNVIANVGASRMFGLEIDGEHQVNDNFLVFGSLGLLNTEITDGGAANANLVGNQFTYAPRATLSLGARYDWNNGVYAMASANWRGSYYSDTANSPIDKVDSRILVDAGVGYQMDNALLSLTVTNLFDEDYLNVSSRAETFFNPGGLVAPGAGREIKLALEMTF